MLESNGTTSGPSTRAIKVFFSYSHKDEELRDKLANHLSMLQNSGIISVWHDRNISAGTEWASKINEHLNTAHVILLLISADFLASEFCWSVELKRAMERHVAGEARVIPIILRSVDWKGAPFGEIQALPTDAVPVTSWPDIDKAFTNVAEGIRRTVEELNGTLSVGQHSQVPRGKLSNVPELPPHFLPRLEELQGLKDIVLGETNQRVVVTGRTRRVGVQGMGGIGKTVLAVALARDENVQRAFPDGVFWITVGQTPELTALQLQLAKALSPDRQQPFTNQSDGAACLREFLASKTCLLLLDDVWQAKHLKAFEALGQNCQMLITTRNRELITASGAIEYPLDVLSHDQALRLLAKWADQEVGEKLPPEAHSVAQECGHLPLALAMIGAMVRGKPDRWGNVLHKLQSADLEKIRQDFPHYPYPNLLTAIQVSVNDLGPEILRHYLDFAVFPEDTPIPEAVLQTLWKPQGLDQYDSQDVLDHLVGRSLVRRDDQGHLSLHDRMALR